MDSGAVATASAETSGVRQSEATAKDGEGDKKATISVVAEKKSEPEPSFEMLPNPARVLPQQVTSYYLIPSITTVCSSLAKLVLVGNLCVRQVLLQR